MLPSPAELTYFHEIASLSNFSRAASKLGVSQPSLSLAVKRMEKMLGTDLFVRHKQGVTLTRAGKKLYAQTKKLLDNWEDLKKEALDSHHEIQGTITLGCHTTTALYFKDFFPALLEKHPKLTFNLKHTVSTNITEQVINSEIDIAVVVNPMMHPDLIVKKLNEFETTFWKGPGKRPMQQLHSDQLIIICDPAIPRTPILLKQWENQKFQTARLLTTSSMEVIADLTLAGCGIGILPSSFTQHFYTGRFERVPNAPQCHDEIYLVYRQENRDVKVVQTVVEAIKEYAKGHER